MFTSLIIFLTNVYSLLFPVVSGCLDSSPLRSTQRCSALGGTGLYIHGYNLNHLTSTVSAIHVGDVGDCGPWKVLNDWMIECRLRVEVPMKISPDQSYKLALVGAGWALPFRCQSAMLWWWITSNNHLQPPERYLVIPFTIHFWLCLLGCGLLAWDGWLQGSYAALLQWHWFNYLTPNLPSRHLKLC